MSSLVNLFLNNVKKHKSRKAIIINDKKSITFDALNHLSNYYVLELQNNEIKKGDVICIAGVKEFDSIAILIASLKLGVIYSFFDPESPKKRILDIFKKCKPAGIFGDSIIKKKTESFLKFNKVKFFNLKYQNNKKISKIRLNNHKVNEFNYSEPAYIQFTSGSTGKPKGVLIKQVSLINFIKWTVEEYSKNQKHVFTNINPLYFDNSVFDIYASLFTGNTLVFFHKFELSDPLNLIKKIDIFKCSIIFSVPSFYIYLNKLNILKKNNLKSVKKIIFGGEGYPKAQLKSFFDLYCSRIDFYNVYGPSECTCICSSYKINKNDFKDLKGLPNLGKIIGLFDFLLIDKKNRVVKDKGELCLIGPNVGLGYFNDQDQTKKSFIQNPLNKRFIDIIYKTGDVVLIDKNSNLKFANRIDNQIKHLGYRIELDEIVHALHLVSGITEAYVFQHYLNDISTIIAVVSTNSSIKFNEKKIKQDLKNKIPNYMIPYKILFENFLPKNANGKINGSKIKLNYKKIL